MEENRPMIVAVDGPAGAGKSSICAQVCKNIGWTYINTGFLYRAIAYLKAARKLDASYTQSDLESLVDDFSENYHWDPESLSLFYRGENITPHLGTAQMGADASQIGSEPIVREKLLPIQRELSLKSPRGAMVDGRDIGTVVFPDADMKIFMRASLDERAKRRFSQLSESKPSNDVPTIHSYEEIRREIELRDQQDRGRGNAPLKEADDAFIFDTSDLDVPSSVEKLTSILKERGLIT